MYACKWRLSFFLSLPLFPRHPNPCWCCCYHSCNSNSNSSSADQPMPSGPKANKYMNRHAAEAREREQQRSSEARAAQAKAKEDAQWANDDPRQQKKEAKQREAEEKARQQAELRASRKEQLLEEERELSQKAPVKVTRRQIQKDLSKMLKDYDREKQSERRQQHGAAVVVGDATPTELPTSNPNKARSINADKEGGGKIAAVGGVGEALSAMRSGLTGDGAALPDDRHIGKRARVLYRHFCEEQLPLLRDEKPGLRRTQYNDVLWEMWQKSPSNPFVQRSELRSKERLEQERRWVEGDDDDDEEEDGGSDGEQEGQ